MEFQKKHFDALRLLIKNSKLPDNFDNESFLTAKEGLDILREMTKMSNCEIAAMLQDLTPTTITGCYVNKESKLFKWTSKGFKYVGKLTLEYCESVKLTPEYCSCTYPERSKETFGDTLFSKCDKCHKILLMHDNEEEGYEEKS